MIRHIGGKWRVGGKAIICDRLWENQEFCKKIKSRKQQ